MSGAKTSPRDRARAMRKTLTPPEARLWSVLKTPRADGWRFRRQAPFRGYFLDFVCFDRRLVVEVDGAFHGTAETARDDRGRDAVLARGGFETLRIAPLDIRDQLDGVMRLIRERLRLRPPTRPSGPPSPSGEG
jgi:very-short-patch-repair endonuclease